MKNFWTTLPQPFFALAPLEDVTDAAFRALIAKKGKPDVMFTEFTSADGLAHIDHISGFRKSRHRLMRKLLYSESERPIVAQLFTSVPEHMEQAAYIVRKMGFDGVDINMGCPDRAVEKSGCGAALIKKPALARELIRAAKISGLPVSIKTRLGYGTDALETWLPHLLAEDPAAITIHARTRSELSDVPARWERIARAVEIRNNLRSKTRIIGNGDVKDLTDARAKAADTKCDGVMLGRAVFGNPWLFKGLRNQYIGPEEKIHALNEHLKLFDELLGDTSNYATMKKHFKSYISGWDGAKEMRVRLMETETVEKAQEILANAILPA